MVVYWHSYRGTDGRSPRPRKRCLISYPMRLEHCREGGLEKGVEHAQREKGATGSMNKATE